MGRLLGRTGLIVSYGVTNKVLFCAKTLKQAVSRVLVDTLTVAKSVKQLRAEVQFLACAGIFLFVTTFTPVQGSTKPPPPLYIPGLLRFTYLQPRTRKSKAETSPAPDVCVVVGMYEGVLISP